MKNKFNKVFLLALISISISLIGLFMGYVTIQNRLNRGLNKVMVSGTDKIDEETFIDFYENLHNEDFSNSIMDEEKITPSTKMIYEYYYTENGHVETTEEEPPYFMLDKTKEEMERTFSDWNIISFSKDEVVMRKEIEQKNSQNYTIGIQDGYIAVFYQEVIDGTKLKEITETPVSALPLEERETLEKGIDVIGDENLVRILEDYGS